MNEQMRIGLSRVVLGALAGFLLLGGLPPGLHGDIIPSSNRVDWVLGETVGVPGGIPNRTTIFTNFTSSATAAQINNALALCPSNQVVKLAAGTYSLGSTLNFGFRKGVTLRGAGPSTILKPAHGDTFLSIGGHTSGNAPTAITGGYEKGSSNITVASTSALSVGLLVKIDQLLDPRFMWASDGIVRAVGQMAQIKAISGDQVTIWPPLYYPMIPGGAPQVKTYGTMAQQAMFCGVEDLTMDCTGGSQVWGVLIIQSYACWLKNVRTIKVKNYHIYMYRDLHMELAKVFCDDSPDYLPNHGGILLGATVTGEFISGSAVYDCILNKILPGIEVNGGSSGNVVAYNYIRDPRYANDSQSVGLLINHSAQNMMNLYEGNIVNMIQSDGYFGGSSHNTIFRNWSTGWTETFTNYNSKPMQLAKFSMFESIVGNVFGISYFTPDYLNVSINGYGYDKSTIYQFGYPSAGNSDYSSVRPPSTDILRSLDLNVEATAYLHGNWESKTKSITWKSGVADRNLPDSLYLATKPSWFGNLAWPPVNPLTGYTNLTFTSIPAGYRFNNGTEPPGTGDSGKPAPPTNLRIAGP